MGVDKSKLDYDRLLDDWAEMIFVEADRCKKISEEAEVGSYRYGYFDGVHKGYIDALAKLSLLENRKYKKYTIDNYKGVVLPKLNETEIEGVLEDILTHIERGD